MALIEKKTRDWWTIYQKWSVVEALLGSGMTVTEYCKNRAQHGQILDWQPEIPKQKMELAGDDSPPLH